MSEMTPSLEAAFEYTDYDLLDVTVNRQTVRLSVKQADADAQALRAIVEEAVGADGFFGLNVTTEQNATDDVGSVVTFQQRG
ncbi:hypothetical protein [Natronocalculus amylovorans]|uniref:Uncharacterized protein n=1 Tax=Natronocalculus amylovorans TaxID=2917812 RepID=A0AAE3KAP1_9EURY|nr:hypothetical protein [Natronocalculus amylovorans]MCL9818440.1 hypothetical protein [Natronocalculus amylovorans]